MTDEFRANAARIEANPLGRLMYGQRELFHSNPIGWYFDMLPEAELFHLLRKGSEAAFS